MRLGEIIWLFLAGLVLLGPAPLRAQEAAPPPAVLVADDVYMEGNERLVATGNVEAI